ncbi:hypothetical protein [Clostridium baratii]|uniref:hypothetical protein n=1 Tax=Clostridium baratii TaxID=1561 RepID=UPI0030CEE131
MGKNELTKKLEKAIMRETSEWFGCLEVTIGWYGRKRVDFMTMDSKEIFRCFEIKISKADFYSKHGHNFVGHFNYYVMPIELFEEVKEKIPKHIGVYTYKDGYLTLVKKSKKQKIEDIDILKNSLIRSLYREACKVMESENIELMKNLKNKVTKLEKERLSDRRYRIAIYEELGRTKFKEFEYKYDL